jgi:WD40 repeat protein/predicted Ser/Thr protein kinase
VTCPFCGAEIRNVTVCPQCGANIAVPSASVSLSLPLGTKLLGGKYTVGKVLGQGGFGITYMGADTVLSRPVAIKELFPEGCQRNGTTVQPTRITPSDFASMKQRFLDEARLLASLNHPGIVKVYDFFEENNTAYMVMEYLRGKSLAKLVEERGGALSEQEAVGYILKVCEALDVVHKSGYLHRDIKPENIIVCDDGRVVLIDFGAARSFMAGRTGRMTVILTPGFAPLEQYAEQAKRGAYTDIYALGATLYYLLTGEVPVSATDRASGVRLRSVREINPMVSERVEKAVMKAMAMKVDERPQSVGEFVKLLTSPSISASTMSKVSVPSTKLSAPPVPKMTLKGVATLRGHNYSVFSVAFSPDGRLLASGSQDWTVKVWDVGSWREIATLNHMGWVLSVTFSPDGRFLASGCGDQTARIWLIGNWLIAATLNHVNPVKVAAQMFTRMVTGINLENPAYMSVVRSLSFSPDGRFLVSGCWDCTVNVWEVESWRKIAVLRHGNWVNSVTFSPDGRFLASGSGDCTVRVWDVRTWDWKERAILKHGGPIMSVAFSPDGRFLASGMGGGTTGRGEVKIWEVGSWREVTTLRGRSGRDIYSVAFSPDSRFLAAGSADGTVAIWEVGSWKEISTLSGHRSCVFSVSFSPNNKFLALGSMDCTVKILEI